MTDSEIKKYLDINNWIVDPQDCIMEVFNTSQEIIIGNHYDFDTSIMTIFTEENIFTFKWILGNGK